MAGHPNSVPFRIAFWTGVVLFIAFWLTLSPVESALPPTHQTNLLSAPLGYTWSLFLVYLPLAILFFWYFHYHNDHIAQKSCLAWTLLVVFVTWTIMDVLAAPSFFQFPNCKATLEWYIPGWIPGSGFTGRIPIEELLFYFGAVALTLMVYIFTSELWFPNDSLSFADRDAEALAARPIMSFNWHIIYLGLLLIIAGVLYKYIFVYTAGHSTPPPIPMPSACTIPATAAGSGFGFPLYYTFLVIALILPPLLLFKKAKIFVNAGALQFTLFWAMLISVVWEVTLALPYGYWDYNHHYMLGVSVPAWYGLPVEATFLWVMAAWGTVFMYETIRLKCITGKSLRNLLFGSSNSTTTGNNPGP